MTQRMTIEGTASTNGRGRVEQAIAVARAGLRKPPRRGLVRPRRLVIPVALALGVILFIRYLEQTTAD